ncbi:MarR family winged helix-turn-helix transcriptional regulator [Neorhizobium sp. NCHU2750]|uniref:MarR family winged helix-turn-helix transcriptional regulator n=1 Tax=Neorhizobium sp. NCHU2750 TaxID=1825976 RepID=UPI000E72E7F1|nr:MarR family transcriptional regulator [Neorhizobium sp. NCHU2750]
MDSRQILKRKATAAILRGANLWRRLAERALADEGISAARADVLIWLYRLGGGLRQVQLADAIGQSSNALVRLLDELSAANLIERKPDEKDRRANAIWLTVEGEIMAARAEEILVGLRDKVLVDAADSDLEAIVRLHETISASITDRVDE